MIKHMLMRARIVTLLTLTSVFFLSIFTSSHAVENVDFSLLDLAEEGIIDKTDSNVPIGLNEEGEFVPLFQDSSSADAIIATARKLLGKKYVTGGTGPETFDCSGFIYYIFKNYDLDTPRSSRDQSEHEAWDKIENVEDLMVGDLVFFMSPGSGKQVGHAGIYLGDDEFIHASPAGSANVTISKINNDYYSQKFKWGRRVF